MSQLTRDPNLDTYNSSELTSHYSSLNYLTPCERLLFDEYLSPGMSILDLGVGGGRTTPYLSSLAGRYVGVDYAAEMISACRKKFPNLEFETADAADLSIFAESSFDAVVMAFNGIDSLFPDESRNQAFREIHRILKPRGVLIFSCHNARSIFVRPSWNPLRLAGLAKKLVGGSALYRPVLWSMTALRIVVALLQSIVKSLARIVGRIPTRAFWSGEGYLMDAAHGGMRIHLSTPEKAEGELKRSGFRPLRVLGDDYPHVSRLYVTDWYYYVFSSAEATGGGKACE
jgi:SAM-dependent methyltransferase